ncbi:hypothetical protein M3650_20060 [Paenibacillus sp. MER TA 81-3]|uniref:hypothetical protein n=1 Tax=Paenibacillus sp. MER TA 81-3 TaxID=2939573 RepID=UPI00203BBCFC|nr:hypothetical protein [Paenibacillus sp. MER TA 81-3]MCM3340864.1 hypothetical protein [Paenibacillus sp. MER TA 81-3]
MNRRVKVNPVAGQVLTEGESEQKSRGEPRGRPDVLTEGENEQKSKVSNTVPGQMS